MTLLYARLLFQKAKGGKEGSEAKQLMISAKGYRESLLLSHSRDCPLSHPKD